MRVIGLKRTKKTADCARVCSLEFRCAARQRRELLFGIVQALFLRRKRVTADVLEVAAGKLAQHSRGFHLYDCVHWLASLAAIFMNFKI